MPFSDIEARTRSRRWANTDTCRVSHHVAARRTTPSDRRGLRTRAAPRQRPARGARPRGVVDESGVTAPCQRRSNPAGERPAHRDLLATVVGPVGDGIRRGTDRMRAFERVTTGERSVVARRGDGHRHPATLLAAPAVRTLAARVAAVDAGT